MKRPALATMALMSCLAASSGCADEADDLVRVGSTDGGPPVDDDAMPDPASVWRTVRPGEGFTARLVDVDGPSELEGATFHLHVFDELFMTASGPPEIGGDVLLLPPQARGRDPAFGPPAGFGCDVGPCFPRTMTVDPAGAGALSFVLRARGWSDGRELRLTGPLEARSADPRSDFASARVELQPDVTPPRLELEPRVARRGFALSTEGLRIEAGEPFELWGTLGAESDSARLWVDASAQPWLPPAEAWAAPYASLRASVRIEPVHRRAWPLQEGLRVWSDTRPVDASGNVGELLSISMAPTPNPETREAFEPGSPGVRTWGAARPADDGTPCVVLEIEPGGAGGFLAALPMRNAVPRFAGEVRYRDVPPELCALDSLFFASQAVLDDLSCPVEVYFEVTRYLHTTTDLFAVEAWSVFPTAAEVDPVSVRVCATETEE